MSVSPSSKPRKWHLTAYFTYADLQSLPTIDNDPTLRSLSIPPGVYRSGKARPSRNSDLCADTSQQSSSSSLASSASSSPPPTPRTLNGSELGSPSMKAVQGHYRPEPRVLPPLHVAIPQDGAGSRPKPINLPLDPRSSEDQRVIHMLNSRHNPMR